MENSKFFIFILCLCLGHILAAPMAKPLLGGKFCSGKDLLDYKSAQEYVYAYETETKLWINDISEESKSEMKLKTTVIISRLGECKFLLRLEDTSLTGDSVDRDENLIRQLNDNVAVFEFNSEGEIDTDIDFTTGDLPWSRNIKRGIISAFQVKSEKNLRKLDESNDSNEMSSVVYETDVLGRCRTTYELDEDNFVSGKSLRLTKRKSLHACSSDYVRKAFTYQGSYRNRPEFYNGRLFIEKFQCNSYVKDNVVDEVICSELATYKIGSKATKGVQVIVKQSLKLNSVNQAMNRMNYLPSSFETKSIIFEFSDEVTDNSDYKNFDSSAFLNRICQKTITDGLENNYSNDFKMLANFLESKKATELVSMYENAKSMCDLARVTFSEALIYTNTEDSVTAILSLLDKNAYNDLDFITKYAEYPQLTFLVRLHDPSVQLINKINDYLSTKPDTFPYLKKMYLVYSTLISTHCKVHECSDSELKSWSSMFAKNLGSNCGDSSKKDLVTVSLKAIGNIGGFENVKTLTNCASTKENSMQVRVSAIESLRKFPFETTNELKDILVILRNTEEDTELRITAFLLLVKGVESEKFKKAADSYLTSFLENETDNQLLTFIIDYAKEHGLTALLNPILSNPKIKEQFTVHFKELSWNRYRYRYSLARDGGLETEATMIYTSNSFIPRSIRFNLTSHLFGASINYVEATLRLEGITDYLKGRIIDKLSTQEVIKSIMEKPERVIEIVQSIADKLKFTAEKPYISFSVRCYESEVYYVELKEMEDLVKFAEFLRNPRDTTLYRKIEYIKSGMMLDKRIRKSLVNGFEMNAFVDVTAAIYASKNSNKVDSPTKREFDINNFYAVSLSMNRKFQVLLNKDNRLTLKKNVFLNGKLNLDVSGVKQNGSITYNLDFAPSERTLLEIDAKFYKMGKNSVYREITQFNVEQHNFDKCMSSKAQSIMGIEWCLKFNRPVVGSLIDALKPYDLDSVIADENEDDDDDNDDDDNDENNVVKRPMLILSGPYHYEIKYKNPENTKTVTLNLKLNNDKAQRLFELKANVQTKSQSGSIKNRLEAVFSRKRGDTKRSFDRTFNFEVKMPQTNEVPFKVAGDVIYKKQELIESNWILESKIIKNYLMTSRILRQVTPGNVIPTYELESEYNSEFRDYSRKLSFKIEPEGLDIKSSLSLDWKSKQQPQIRIVDIQGNFIHNKDSSETDVDYNVELKYSTFKETNARLYGNLVATMFKSDIDLNLDFNSKYFTLSSPANIKFGHVYDGSNAAKSSIELAVKVPSTPINHGIKVLAGLNDKFTLDSLEFQVKTPSTQRDKPYTLLVSRTASAQGGETTIMIDNFNIDLSQRTNPISAALVKVDNDNILRKLVIMLSRKMSQDGNSEFGFAIEKNDRNMAKLDLTTVFKLDMNKLLAYSSEIPKQEVSATLSIKVLENSGSMKAKFNLEKSDSQKVHIGEFEFKTEDILKFLTRIDSIRTKFEKRQGSLNANFETIRLGDLRSLKFYTTGSLRKNGEWNENDVAYEKSMANGDKIKATGTLKYILQNYLNYQVVFNVDNYLRFNLMGQTQNDYIMHKISHARLDYNPIEAEYKLKIAKKTEDNLNMLDVNIEGKRGAPNSVDDLIFSANMKNINLNMNGISTALNKDLDLLLKIKSMQVDINEKVAYKYDLKTKTFSFVDIANGQYPNYKNPSDIIKINEKIEMTGNTNKEFKINYQSQSNFMKSMKKLNMDFSREIINGNVNYNLNTIFNDNKNFNAKMVADLATYGLKVFQMSVKQNLMESYYSKLLKKEISIRDCAVESSYERIKDKSSGKYLLDTFMNGKCDGQILGDFKFRIARTYPQNMESWPLFSFHRSKITWVHQRIDFGKLLVEFTIEKENPKMNGFYEIKAEVNDNKYLNSISYNREVDPTTQNLAKGNYKMITILGSTASKTCDMIIESSTNYYNTLNCKMTTTSMPIETSFGYALKREKVTDKTSHEKSVVLDVNIPGRTIRVDYKRTKESSNLNDGAEYEATAKLYLDYSNNRDKFTTISFKREQIAPGNTKSNLVILNNPLLTIKKVELEIERMRKMNETQFKSELSYELSNGKTNSLKGNLIMASDFTTNSLTEEISLDRPNVNIKYENEFNKNDGKLQYMSLRMGKLLKFKVDKEDPENRTICIEFANPDETKYTVDSTKNLADGVFVVKSVLKSNNAILSTMTSSFDSNNNLFNVEIIPVKANNAKVYKLNFGMYSEEIANAMITEETDNSKTILGSASLKVVKHNGHKDLVMNMKWNRLWNKIKSDILNEKPSSENSNYNSYFGDVYGVLVEDLKPALDNIRNARSNLNNDFKKLGYMIADFYSNIYPPMKTRMNMLESTNNKMFTEEIPLYKRVFASYNSLAQQLEDLNLKMRAISKPLSKLIPRLPVMKYNSDKFTKNIEPFSNNLEISRPTLNAHNLYQFSAEYRDYLRQLANNIQDMKNSMIRNLEGYSVKGLINKYKFRALSSYAMVGHIYNRRNVISFDGEVTTLKSKCRYLLAHELRKNQFSVILNHNDSPYIISVSAYGSDLIDISYDKASINNQEIMLPHISSNGKVLVSRTYNGVCLNVDDDLSVCCNKDSKSCSVALTRWYTGKVNGLLGKTNYDRDNAEEDKWYLEPSCKLLSLKLKEPSQTAIDNCKSIFGKNRKSIFRDALTVMDAVNDGWKTLCESVLTVNPNGKCEIMKAFAYHAKIKSVDVDVPNECFECKINNMSFKVGEKLPNQPIISNQEWDSVFILLPCENKKYSLDDLSNIQKKFQSKHPSNKQYFIKVIGDDASIIQSSSSQMANLDYKMTSSMKTEMINNKGLYKALFLAGSIFADSGRIAGRFVTIVSCDNCMLDSFSNLPTLRLERMLRERNILVSSWGNYQMVDKENDSDDETPFGYSNNNVFLMKKDNTVIIEDLNSYKIEHKSDLCSRLAEKTKGGIFNINHIRKATINEKVINGLVDAMKSYEATEAKCQRVDTDLGDITDISFKRVMVRDDEDN